MLLIETRISSAQTSLLSLRSPHFLYELSQPAVIFPAWAGLHAARDVDSVGTHDANCRAHILDFQPARQNNTVSQRRAASHVPVRGMPCTTILAGLRGVKQKGESLGVLVKACKGKFGLDAEGFDDGHKGGDFCNGLRWLVAVELDRIQLERSSKRNHVRRQRIDENAYGFHSFWQVSPDLGGFLFRNTSRAFFV